MKPDKSAQLNDPFDLGIERSAASLSPNRRRVALALTFVQVAALVAFVAHEALSLGDDGDFWDTWVCTGVILTAAASIVVRAVLIPMQRASWLWVALALALWASGFLTYNLVIADRDPIPYPSWADAAWLGFFPAMLIGLAGLARGRGSVRRGLWIDALIGTLALASIVAVFLITPIISSTGGSFRTITINLAYPLGDVLCLGFVLIVFANSGWRPGGIWWVMGAALAFSAALDTVYLYQAAAGTYEPGGLFAAGWPIVAAAFAAAAWFAPLRTAEPRQLSQWNVAVPLGFGILGVGILTVGSFHSVGTTGLLLAAVTVLSAFGRTLATSIDLAKADQCRELLRRQSLILDAAGEGIYGLDIKGRIIFANAAAAAMSGYARADMVGRVAHQLLHHSHNDGTSYPEEECPVTSSLSTGLSASVNDEVYWRANATCIPVEYTTTPLRDGERLVGAVVVFRDITARREVERMKDEFISIVSHELRTPLTSIRGSLGLLATGVLGQMPAKAQRMLEVALSNTDRLARLVNDILDMERIQSGSITLERQRLSARALILQAREVMEGLAENAGIRLAVTGVEADVCGDSDQITQILTNLLSNAIKFSDRGTTVEVTAERRGAEVLFSVRDEGPGIPPDDRKRIFDRFYQVDSSDARSKGGTGLGLPISQKIVAQHGGRIWVESTFGAGSKFSFTLPAIDVPAQGFDGGDGAPVLVLDDDAAVPEVMSELPICAGYRPVPAASGGEALEATARERPGAIRFDPHMPGGRGWETAAQLKAQPQTAQVPIVTCTPLPPQETEVTVGADIATRVGQLANPQSLADAPERALAPPRPSRVLVVEDDPDLSAVLTTIVEGHGLETFHAGTGAEALDVIERVLPDLVLLDLALPDVDGFEVVNLLRRRERLRKMPLVIYTAQDLDDSQRKRLRLGETAFFTKGRVPPNLVGEAVGLLQPRRAVILDISSAGVGSGAI